MSKRRLKNAPAAGRPLPMSCDEAVALAVVTACLRAGVGLAAALFPYRSGRLLFSRKDDAAAAHLPLRWFGVRDVALALGALAAVSQGPAPLRNWVIAGALCDVADVTAMAMDRGRTVRRPVGLLASTGALGATAGAAAIVRALRPNCG